jgi:hypothetical protein
MVEIGLPKHLIVIAQPDLRIGMGMRQLKELLHFSKGNGSERMALGRSRMTFKSASASLV